MKPLPLLLALMALMAPFPQAQAESRATLFGKEVVAPDASQLQQTIASQLFERYAQEQKITSTDTEVDALLQRLAENEKENSIRRAEEIEKLEEELKDQSLTGEARETKESLLKIKRKVEEMSAQMAGRDDLKAERRNMAARFVQAWKINQSLYQQYGGRVIFQQAGPEPIDAYRQFLESEEKKGSFQINDEAAKAEFWRYYRNEKMHLFMDEEKAKEAMTTPWWKLEKQPGR